MEIVGLNRDERYTISHLDTEDWLFPRIPAAAESLREKGLVEKWQTGYGFPRYRLTEAGDGKIWEIIEAQAGQRCPFCDGLWFVQTVNGKIDETMGNFCVNPECCISENKDMDLWRAAQRFESGLRAAVETEKPTRRDGSVAVSYPWGREGR